MRLYTIVQIEGDPEQNHYRVSGHDPASGRWWLTVTNPRYDGYNGDLILSEQRIVLCDDRCSLPRSRELTIVETAG